MPLTDPKGTPVQIDSYVQGFFSDTKKTGFGRVYAIQPQGHVAVWTDDESILNTRQTIMYEGKYLVRGAPRPLKQRDIPERLQR